MSQTKRVVRPSTPVVHTGRHVASHQSSRPLRSRAGRTGAARGLRTSTDESKSGRLLNPFREQIRERLRRLGGQYAASGADRLDDETERLLEFEFQRLVLANDQNMPSFLVWN